MLTAVIVVLALLVLLEFGSLVFILTNPTLRGRLLDLMGVKPTPDCNTCSYRQGEDEDEEEYEETEEDTEENPEPNTEN